MMAGNGEKAFLVILCVVPSTHRTYNAPNAEQHITHLIIL
jgi:hypothetical protein